MHSRTLFTSTLATTLVVGALSVATGVASASAAPVGTSAEPTARAAATSIVSATDGRAWISRASSYSPQPGPIVAGEGLSLSLNVVDSAGARVYDGTLTVERQIAGSSTWSTVASATSAYLYESVEAVANATYRVTYSGTETYAPATVSAPVKVQRALNARGETGKRLYIAGKVTDYRKKKVTIQRKAGSSWKVYTKTRTTKKGAFKVRVAAPARVGGKIRYRAYVPSSTTYATSTSNTLIATKRRY